MTEKESHRASWLTALKVFLIFCVVSVVALFLIGRFFGKPILKWLDHKRHTELLEFQLTFDAENFNFVGHSFEKIYNGDLELTLGFNNRAVRPLEDFDESKYLLHVTAKILIDGETIHSANATCHPRSIFVEGTISSPRFPNVNDYVANRAKLHLTITQEDRLLIDETFDLKAQTTSGLAREYPRGTRSWSYYRPFQFIGKNDKVLEKGLQHFTEKNYQSAISELSSYISKCPFTAKAYDCRGQAEVVPF